MSPLPTMPHHHHHPMQSPNFGSPGMMAFPSPGPPMRGGTPGRHMPYMPPQYEPSPDRRVVEQRRNPDGSTSIQIGGHSAGEPHHHHHDVYEGDEAPEEDAGDEEK
jgi:hypothetical protein